jgi:hypothetical protein
MVVLAGVVIIGALLMDRACSNAAPSKSRGAKHIGADNQHSTPVFPRPLGRAPASSASALASATRSGAEALSSAPVRLLATTPPERNTGEMDQSYPGFNRAYRDGRDADNMAFRKQHISECIKQYAPGREDFEWDEIQTFMVDNTGRAVLSDIAIVPKTTGIDQFYRCVGEGMVGNRTFQAPPNTPEAFTIRESNARYFRPLTKEEIIAQIPNVEAMLRGNDISPERRVELEHYLALWQCMLNRGFDDAACAACRREIGDD